MNSVLPPRRASRLEEAAPRKHRLEAHLPLLHVLVVLRGYRRCRAALFGNAFRNVFMHIFDVTHASHKTIKPYWKLFARIYIPCRMILSCMIRRA